MLLELNAVLAACSESGAPWAIDYYISVNMNNNFYGMFTLVEVQDDEYLAVSP